MKILQSIFLSLLVILTLACGMEDMFSPSEPRESIRSLDFTCVESPANVLRCTSTVSGGDFPLTYIWQASFLTEISGTAASTVSFDYTDICNGRLGSLNVTVTLNIRDGRGEMAGPITKPFNVCS